MRPINKEEADNLFVAVGRLYNLDEYILRWVDSVKISPEITIPLPHSMFVLHVTLSLVDDKMIMLCLGSPTFHADYLLDEEESDRFLTELCLGRMV